MENQLPQDLEKEVRRLKRIAAEWAGRVHDLVEERLPASFEELPELTRNTYEACKAWADANARLQKAKTGTSPSENL